MMKIFKCQHCGKEMGIDFDDTQIPKIIRTKALSHLKKIEVLCSACGKWGKIT